MVNVPKQDWRWCEVESRSDNTDWIRGLTPTDRFALYEDMFDLVWKSRPDLGDWTALTRWNWNNKVARRLEFLAAVGKLDQLRRERAAATNAG